MFVSCDFCGQSAQSFEGGLLLCFNCDPDCHRSTDEFDDLYIDLGEGG